MKAEKILFITQEINPYVPDSALTKMGRDLPLYALDKDREIRAFMPKWGNINERRNQLHEVIRLSGMNIVVDDTDHQLIIKVASVMGTRMQVYFIDNEDFFAKRLAEKDKEGKEYEDNTSRAAFYARGVLETVKKLRWKPDVIHCQGWISSLVPIYIKTAYADEPYFHDCRVVYSVADSQLTKSTGEHLDQILDFRTAGSDSFKEFGLDLTPDDLLKLAIKYSDGIVFTTPNVNPSVLAYAKATNKLLTKDYTTDLDAYVNFFDAVWNNGKTEKQED